MRRPRKEVEKFVTVSELKLPVIFAVEFDRPIPLRQARQIARRVLDQTQISGFQPISDDAFAGASLRCSQLPKLIKLVKD